MGTVTKALTLLNLFSNARPEIGLSDFARLAKRDKATALRLLNELADNGFVEQDSKSKLYRLGPALIRLANIRELTVPANRAAEQALKQLAIATNETVHLSVLNRQQLSTLAHIENSTHATRVHIDPAEMLPLHATGSGLVVLAFSNPALVNDVLTADLDTWTTATHTDAKTLGNIISNVAKTGFGVSDQGFEKDVYGIAAPLFGPDGTCTGAVAVAAPTTRMSPDLEALVRAELIIAACSITHSWGGTIPTALNDIWNK